MEIAAERGPGEWITYKEVEGALNREHDSAYAQAQITRLRSELRAQLSLGVRHRKGRGYRIMQLGGKDGRSPVDEVIAAMWAHRDSSLADVALRLRGFTECSLARVSTELGFTRKIGGGPEGESRILAGPCLECGEHFPEEEVGREGVCGDCEVVSMTPLERERRKRDADPVRAARVRATGQRTYIRTQSGHRMGVSKFGGLS